MKADLLFIYLFVCLCFVSYCMRIIYVVSLLFVSCKLRVHVVVRFSVFCVDMIS